jgi:hypothetical protein
MSELEERLNRILSSPEDMERIMGIARTIAASTGAGADASPSTESPSGSSTPSGGPDLSSLTAMIGNIDPSMFRLLSRVVTEMGAGGSDKAELFKPYLKEDRRDKIDKAISIAKIAKLARVAFAEFSEGGL